MKKNFLALAFALIFCCACSDDVATTDVVQYIPFQSQEDGRWGMIDSDGKVLFEEEFKEKPTLAINGRFIVKNSKGLYEIYTAEKKPHQVGEAYKEVGSFYEDVAPAVKEGKPVCLIDRDGKVVKELMKLSGKTVSKVTNFYKGIALFCTNDNLWGAINTKGDVVVEPKYIETSIDKDYFEGLARFIFPMDNIVFAVDKKYSKVDTDKWKACVVDLETGKVLAEMPYNKVRGAQGNFVEGCCVIEGENGTGIMDLNGEWVMKPKFRYDAIILLGNKQFTFDGDGDRYGLATFDGETLIRPKYHDPLFYVADNLLFVGDETKETNERYYLINKEGDRVGNEAFSEFFPFFGNNALVKMGDHEYGFVDKEGKIVKPKDNVDIYEVSLSCGDELVRSDYVDNDAKIAFFKEYFEKYEVPYALVNYSEEDRDRDCYTEYFRNNWFDKFYNGYGMIPMSPFNKMSGGNSTVEGSTLVVKHDEGNWFNVSYKANNAGGSFDVNVRVEIVEFENHCAINDVDRVTSDQSSENAPISQVVPLSDLEATQSVQTEQPQVPQVYSEDSDGWVNIRQKPSSKSQILGQMYNDGDPATYLGRSGNWVKVNYKGTVGYLHKDHCRVVQ